MIVTGWCSKGKRGNRVAHYLTDGRPHCATVVFAQGRMLSAFRCDWEPLRKTDHLCSFCRKVAPKTCVCGVCSVVQRPGDALARRVAT